MELFSFHFIKVSSTKDLSCCCQLSWQARPPWEEKTQVFLQEASEAWELLIRYNKNSEAGFDPKSLKLCFLKNKKTFLYFVDMKQVCQENLQKSYFSFSRPSTFTRLKRATTLHMYIWGGVIKMKRGF